MNWIYSDVELYVPHKSASSLHDCVVKSLIRAFKSTKSKLKVCDTGSGEEPLDHLKCYDGKFFLVGVLRFFVNFRNKVSRQIFILRDPRDRLVSEYQSYAYHHAPPSDPEKLKAFLEYRQRLLDAGLSNYLKNRIFVDNPNLRDELGEVLEHTNYQVKTYLNASDVNGPGLYILPYDLISDEKYQKSYIKILCNVIRIPNEKPTVNCEDVILKDCGELFSKPKKLLGDHINKPEGKYWKDLSEDDQLLLNISFAREVAYLEALNHKYRQLIK